MSGGGGGGDDGDEGLAGVLEDVDGVPGKAGLASEEASDGDGAAAVDGDCLVSDAGAREVTADVVDGVAEAAAGDEEVVGGAGGVGDAAAARKGNAVHGLGDGGAREEEEAEGQERAAGACQVQR